MRGAAAAGRLRALRRGLRDRRSEGAAPSSCCSRTSSIGLHEQTRLQPEIGEALDAPYVTAEELGRMLCGDSRPAAARGPSGVLAAARPGLVAELSREIITHSLMVLSLPGRILALGTHLPDAYPEALPCSSTRSSSCSCASTSPSAPAPTTAAPTDWSALEQRMHYISHLFRAFHADADLAVAAVHRRAGPAVPRGRRPRRRSLGQRRPNTLRRTATAVSALSANSRRRRA